MIEYEDPRAIYPDSLVAEWRRIYVVDEILIHYIEGIMYLVIWCDDKWRFGLHSISKMPDNPPRVTCLQSSPNQVPPPPGPLKFHGIEDYQPSPFDSQEWNGRMKRWGWLNEAA